MKYLLLFLFASLSAFSQDFIQTKDGKKILPVEGSISVQPNNKRIKYKLPNEEKRKKIKFKDIASTSYKDREFRTVEVDRKTKGYFIMADANGKQLGVIASNRVVNKGGFDVPYTRYDVAVIGKDNNVIKNLVFTDVNNPTNISLRAQARELIQQEFADCANILERLRLSTNTENKIENGDVTELLENPYQTSCK